MVDVTLHVQVAETVYEEALERAKEEGRAVEEILKERLLSVPGNDSPEDDYHIQMLRREQQAFDAMRTELWERYPHEYAALLHGSLIDHDPDDIRLIERLEVSHPHEELIFLTQILPEELPPLRFRSPSWLESE